MNLSKVIDVISTVDFLRSENYVWSADFDAVRLPLADLIESMAVALDAASEVMASITSEFPNG